MKLLILSALLISSSYAQQRNEMPVLGKEFVTKVKDLEVEKMLASTSVFNKCASDHTYDEKKSDADKDKVIQAAKQCMIDALGTGQKSQEELKKLSEKLNLEGYGLVKSKNIADITEYMTDKLYKAMTGYSRQEKDKQKLLASLKFGNKKMINQSTFIHLYKTQLGKSALQEVSRYCFENLRIDGNTGDTFEAHWSGKFSDMITRQIANSKNPNSAPLNVDTPVKYTDLGSPDFLKTADLDLKDPSKNYEVMMKQIATSKMSDGDLEAFFFECSEAIKGLCEKFEEETKKGNIKLDKSVTTNNLRGSKSCLMKNNMQEYQKALANADKVIKQFEELDGPSVAVLLDKGAKGNFFDSKTDPNNSIDDLTSVTSQDILEGVADNEVSELAEKCKNKPKGAGCEKFLIESDSLNKAEFDIQMQFNAKTELEKARVKDIVANNAKSLDQYLADNGFQKIAEDLKAGTITNNDVERLIGEAFEARKNAAVLELRNKMGKRQKSSEELKNSSNAAQDKEDIITANADFSLTEKARMAQVVLFNNIILSSLNLKDGTGKTVGKNIKGLEKERANLEQKQGVNSAFFDGLKNYADKNKGGGTDKSDTLAADNLIGLILGKKP